MVQAQNPLTPSIVKLDQPATSNLSVPERALAIGAHPDDVDFCCGTTLAKWAAAGCEVSILVCTDGSKGTWDPEADTAELIARRQDEQRAAAAKLGATGEVVFLGWADGELPNTPEQVSQIAYWIRKLRPTIVLGHDPWRRYRLHPDHRNAGWITCDGVVAARDPKFFPEHGLPKHRSDSLLLFEAESPDHFEDSESFLEVKLQALLSHESQFETTMKTADSQSPDNQTSDGASGTSLVGAELAEFRSRLEAKQREAGRAAGIEQAEVFKLIDDL